MPAPGGRNGAESPVRYQQPSEWPTALLWFGSIGLYLAGLGITALFFPDYFVFALIGPFALSALAEVFMHL